MSFKIPVSAGELADKITILEIKTKRIKDKSKLKAASTELKLLRRSLQNALPYKIRSGIQFKRLMNRLLKVNQNLWNIENRIRQQEALKKFDVKFINLARSVYINNDLRSAIKDEINNLTGSVISEVKQYSQY
jgi:hypothetical protein